MRDVSVIKTSKIGTVFVPLETVRCGVMASCWISRSPAKPDFSRLRRNPHEVSAAAGFCDITHGGIANSKHGERLIHIHGTYRVLHIVGPARFTPQPFDGT